MGSYALVGGLLALALRAGPAAADPCDAIPESGPMPSYLGFGATFSGPVVHVIDGDSLCVAVGEGQSNWVEVRLSDFFAPEFTTQGGPAARTELARLTLGRQATCVANLRTYDRIAARCRIEGQSVGDMMRSAGVREGGNGQSLDPPVRHAVPLRSSSTPTGAMFRSCAAARAAGAAPLRRGSPGYNPNLDGDADGVACEPYRNR